MNTIDLNISTPKKKRIRLHYVGPSSWAELSDRQAVQLTRVRTRIADHHNVVFAALIALYRMKRVHQRWLFDESYLRRKSLHEEDIVLFLEQGQNTLDTLKWVGEPDPKARFPNRFRRFDFYFSSPLMWLKRSFNRTQYAGPLPGLGECTFEEFMFADAAYRAGNLPLLAAILCRPVDPDYVKMRRRDVRAPLNRHDVDERERLFADLDPALLDLIAFAFGSTLLRLQKHFRYVFPLREEDEEDAKQNKKSGTWLDVAVGMAKLDVTKINAIERSDLYLALKVLDVQLQQDEETQKMLEKSRPKKS